MRPRARERACWWWYAALFTLAWVLAAAQTSAASGLEVRADAVDVSHLPNAKVYVTVLDSSGEPIKGLKTQNFAIEEQPLNTNEVRKITDFTAKSVLESGQKLAIALVIDRSGSMRGAPLREAKKAVAEFVSRLSEGDKVAVLSFSTSVRTDCGFTSDRGKVRAALDKVHARGDTALYDAAKAAVDALGKASGATRKAVVLLTDGQRTTGSLSEPGPAVQAAKQANVRLFTVGLGHDPEHDVLEKLSGETNGSHFRAGTPRDLLAIYQKIADQLQNQYVIAYNRPEDVRFHELTVRVSYGNDWAEGERKYRPKASDAPPPPQPPPDATTDGPSLHMKIALGILWGLVVVVLGAIVVVAARRRKGIG